MNTYIVKMTCKNVTKFSNLRKNDVVYLDNVLGIEKFTKDKDNSYRFLSAVRAEAMCDKLNKLGNFVCNTIKY